MTPTVGYMITAVIVSGIITVLLRALPFAALVKIRRSRFVQAMGKWMPIGILLILVAVTVRDLILVGPHNWWIAAASIVVTIGVHLITKRQTVWSVAAGTACYIILLNTLG